MAQTKQILCACGCGLWFTPNPMQPKQKYVNKQHKTKARNQRMRQNRTRRYIMPIVCPICHKNGYLWGIYLNGELSSLEIYHRKIVHDPIIYKQARMQGFGWKVAKQKAKKGVYLGNCYFALT